MKITPNTRKHLTKLKNFINLNQLSVMISVKELVLKMETIFNTVENMPKVYEQEELEADERKFYLHYFNGNSDFYIAEKDVSEKQIQAYGFVCLNGDKQNAEFGYINIEELITYGVEIDLHFQPCLQKEILQKFKD